MCSLLAARNRLGEEERFLMSVFIGRSARVIRVSATSEQMCNWCWDSPGVPPGSTLSPFWFRWVLWRGVASMCPLFTPSSHHTGQHRVKNEKAKRDKRYPRRRIRFNFVPFSPASYVSFLPAGVIALPTRREAGIWCSGGEVCRRCLLLFPDLHGRYHRMVDKCRDTSQSLHKVTSIAPL